MKAKEEEEEKEMIEKAEAEAKATDLAEGGSEGGSEARIKPAQTLLSQASALSRRAPRSTIRQSTYTASSTSS